MAKIRSMAGAALMAGILIVGLSACQKKEGPAERAGKEVDKSVEKVGQSIEKAGQSLQDAANNAKK